MNIILQSRDNISDLAEKYTVLELDSFRLLGHSDPITAFCLIENVPIDQITAMQQYIDLHAALLKNYRSQNWKFCQDALEHLMGKWGGQLDSFYAELSDRINNLSQADLVEDWDGVLDRRHLR